MADKTASDRGVPRVRSRQELAGLFGGLASTLLVGIVITGLYVGSGLFIPLAMAILLSFALAPMVTWLERRHFPRGLAVVMVVFCAFASLLGLGALVTKQLADLASELPRYERTIKEKLHSLRGDGSSSLERAAEVLEDLGAELNGDEPTSDTVAPPNEFQPTPGAATPAAGEAASPSDANPMPVEIHEAEPGVIERIGDVVAPLVEPLVSAFIILIFVIFILLQREDLRNRLVRLAGRYDMPRTTAALDDAATRISHLFLLQLLVNGAFGAAIGLGLWLIGMPNALLWGVLGTVLRFLPFVGFILAGIIPVIVAFAIGQDWDLMLWTLGLYLVIEAIIGNVIEPWAYGRGTGLSPVAVVVSAAFWALLWGPIGLVLATPLTVCLVVLGRHVESLQFLDILFGDRPVLSPPQLFYQRMLAGDPIEAAAEAETLLKDRPLGIYYEEVAIAGLRLAQEDQLRGSLDDERVQQVRDTVRELAGDLLWQEPLKAEDAAGIVASRLPFVPPAANEGEGPNVLCVGGVNQLDEAAGALLAQVLRRQGLPTQAAGPDILSFARLDELGTLRPTILCLCYLDLERPALLRYTVRRIRRRLPQATILVGCWPTPGTPLDVAALKTQSGADAVCDSLPALAKHCLQTAGAIEVVPPEAPVPADEPKTKTKAKPVELKAAS